LKEGRGRKTPELGNPGPVVGKTNLGNVVGKGSVTKPEGKKESGGRGKRGSGARGPAERYCLLLTGGGKRREV